jgi:hypothetical protein
MNAQPPSGEFPKGRGRVPLRQDELDRVASVDRLEGVRLVPHAAPEQVPVHAGHGDPDDLRLVPSDLGAAVVDDDLQVVRLVGGEAPLEHCVFAPFIGHRNTLRRPNDKAKLRRLAFRNRRAARKPTGGPPSASAY